MTLDDALKQLDDEMKSPPLGDKFKDELAFQVGFYRMKAATLLVELSKWKKIGIH